MNISSSDRLVVKSKQVFLRDTVLEDLERIARDCTKNTLKKNCSTVRVLARYVQILIITTVHFFTKSRILKKQEMYDLFQVMFW